MKRVRKDPTGEDSTVLLVLNWWKHFRRPEGNAGDSKHYTKSSHYVFRVSSG